ncbi:hypothetical protein AURDEDRAFT_184633 [Auricularia subglabra TFB-10046 SS5]|nr:hypothetical protein AURDEDRAFT_184633 [Auricularia subglabra TFB-10046 SS5]
MAPDDPAPPPAPAAQPSADSLKRDYLSLLSKDKLVDLLLALDNDCTYSVFPDNLADAVQQLRAAKPPTPPPVPPPAPATAPAPAALPTPVALPDATASPDGPVAGPSLYTSAPLAPGRRMKNENGEPTEMPSYEEMIAQAISELADPEGTAPKVLFQWMDQNYPLQANFRPSASQALQRAYKRGRLDKLPSGRYILNPNWDGAPTSKRATRRPKQVKVESIPAPGFKPPPPVTVPAGQPKPYPYAAVAAAKAAAVAPRASVTPARDEDVPMEDATPSPGKVTVVKKEEVDTGMELDPALTVSVHTLFTTLAKQLSELQAERRKKPR